MSKPYINVTTAFLFIYLAEDAIIVAVRDHAPFRIEVFLEIADV